MKLQKEVLAPRPPPQPPKCAHPSDVIPLKFFGYCTVMIWVLALLTQVFP